MAMTRRVKRGRAQRLTNEYCHFGVGCERDPGWAQLGGFPVPVPVGRRESRVGNRLTTVPRSRRGIRGRDQSAEIFVGRCCRADSIQIDVIECVGHQHMFCS